jgi:hypothetical protein
MMKMVCGRSWRYQSVAIRFRHVDDDSRLFFGRSGFEGDGAMGVEELVGDVGEDGGAARGDAAFGYHDEEASEELADVGAGREFGEFGEEIGGEVFRVVMNVHGWGGSGVCLGVAETRARVSRQAGEAAALAVGIEIRTARRIGFRRDGYRIGDKGGANGCGVHEFFLFLVERGVHPPLHAGI